MLGGPAVDETLVDKRNPGNQQARPVEPEWVFGSSLCIWCIITVTPPLWNPLSRPTYSLELAFDAIHGHFISTSVTWDMSTKL